MIRRLVVGALVALAAVALTAAPAAAHARLEQTTPAGDTVLDAPPTEVTLRFTEAVDPGLGGVKVIAPDGRRADRGRTELAEDDRLVQVPVDAGAEGTYTVAWSVLSADSHTISGSFVFSVGRVTGAADLGGSGRSTVRLAAGAARWAAFGGTIVLAGALAFLVVVAADIGARRDRLARLMLAGALAAAVGAAGILVTQVALASGRPLGSSFRLLGDAIGNTRFGALGFTRVCLAAGAAAVVARPRFALRPPVPAVVAAAVVGLLVVPGLAGHAWTVEPRWAAVAVDGLHLAAASVWVGGLAALLVVTPGLDAVALLARRFSTLALGSVAVVVATGVASSYLQVRSIDALTATAYGKLLIAKVVVVASLVALGWLNRRRLLALLPQRETLFGVVRAELALAVVVIAVTAVLVNRPPARDEVTGPFATTVATQEDPAGGQVQLQVDPARAGQNDVHLYFLSAEGLPRAVDAIEMTVGRAGVPPRRVTVTPVTLDHASAYGVALPSPGTWTLTITAVRQGQPFTASVEVPIR